LPRGFPELEDTSHGPPLLAYFPLAGRVVAVAINVRRFFHGFTGFAAVFFVCYGAGTDRMRAFFLFSH
jgi:hypothetical protein